MIFQRKKKKVPPKPPAPAAQAEQGEREVQSHAFRSKLSPEAKARLEAHDVTMDEVQKFAEDDPEAASMLLRLWLMEGKK